MFTIDVKTLFLVSSFGNLIIIVIFFIYFRIYPGPRGNKRLLFVAESLLCIAFFLFANRPFFSSLPFVGLSNALLLFGLSYEIYVLVFAVRGFDGRGFIVTNVVSGIFTLVFAAALPFGPNMWVVVMSAILFLQLAVAGVCLNFHGAMNRMQIYAGRLLLILSVVMAVRCIYAIVRGGNLVLQTSDAVQSVSYVTFFVITYLLPILYLFILRELDILRIAESEKRYRSLFERAGSGILIGEIVDGDYLVLAANPAFCAFTQSSLDGVIGRRITEIIPGLERAPFYENLEEVVRTGRPADFEGGSEEMGRYFFVNAYKAEDRKFVAIVQDLTGRRDAELSLRRTLDEKQELLKELQHRVKNSFAMIHGLINIASMNSTSEEAKSTLEHVLARVGALSELYSLLYVSETVKDVRLDEYCDRIADSAAGMAKDVVVAKRLEPLVYTVKNASAVGIILAELLTNAAKYAFPDGRKGRIEVVLRRNGASGILEVSDNGVGFSTAESGAKESGFGLNLVRSLADQLGGAFSLACDGGTRCVLEFPLGPGA